LWAKFIVQSLKHSRRFVGYMWIGRGGETVLRMMKKINNRDLQLLEVDLFEKLVDYYLFI